MRRSPEQKDSLAEAANLSPYQTEKFSKDVAQYILGILAATDIVRCSCGKLLVWGLKKESLKAFSQVCKRWRAQHRIFVKFCTEKVPNLFCFTPKICVLQFLEQYARSVPPHPLLFTAYDLKKWRRAHRLAEAESSERIG